MSAFPELFWATLMVMGLLGLVASFFAARDPSWERQEQLELDAEAGEHGRAHPRNRQRRRGQA